MRLIRRSVRRALHLSRFGAIVDFPRKGYLLDTGWFQTVGSSTLRNKLALPPQ